MRRTRAIGLGLLLWGTLALVGPELKSGFRAEDFLAYEHYRGISILQCFTRSHLDAEVVRFYRPVGDALCWILVRLPGHSPWLAHVLLLGLHVAASLSVVWAARRLLDLRLGACLTAGFLALVHPYFSTVALYLDGGPAQLGLAFFTMASLAQLGLWQIGKGSQLALLFYVVLGTLSFDAGLALPWLLLVVAFLFPPGVKRIPWSVAVWAVLAILLRIRVLGGMGGYRLAWTSPEILASLGRGWIEVLARTLIPSFDGLHPEPDLHSPALASFAACVWLLTLLAGVVFLLRTSARGDSALWGGRVKKLAALALLFLGLLLPATIDPASEAGRGGSSLPIHAYRLYPAALVGSLLFGWILSRASQRAWWGSLLCAGPWLVTLWVLGAPIREGMADAGRRADGIREQVARLAEDRGERHVLLAETPLMVYGGRRELARLFQYGLSGACRPPFLDPAVPVLPVFAALSRGNEFRTAAALKRLAACPWVLPLRYDHGRDLVEPVVPGSLEAPDPAYGELVLLPPSGRLPDPRASPEEAAETVPVGPRGELSLFVRGAATGHLRFQLLNPVHPYFAMEEPELNLLLRRVPQDGQPGDVLLVAALQFLEPARRFPEAICFALLEAIPEPGSVPGPEIPVVVSNVLPLRLRELAREEP